MSTMSDLKRCSEALLNGILGYRGYAEATERRSSDEALRNHLLTEFTRFQDYVERSGAFTKDGDPDFLKKMQRVGSMLTPLMSDIQKPIYSGSAFFDRHKISNAEADRLYEYDLRLVNQMTVIRDEVRLFVDEQGGEDGWGEGFIRLTDFIDGFGQTLAEREMLIAGEEE